MKKPPEIWRLFVFCTQGSVIDFCKRSLGAKPGSAAILAACGRDARGPRGVACGRDARGPRGGRMRARRPRSQGGAHAGGTPAVPGGSHAGGTPAVPDWGEGQVVSEACERSQGQSELTVTPDCN